MHAVTADIKSGRISLHEVEMELIAQLERFEALVGSKPHHIDGHQHVHVLEGIAEVVARVCAAHQVKTVRLPQENIANVTWLSSEYPLHWSLI